MKKVRGVNVRGFEKVERNLNTALHNLKVNSVEGLTDVARRVHYEADTTPPLIPVDTGDLRRSRFIITSRGNIPWRKSGGFVRPGMMGQHRKVIIKHSETARMSRNPKVILGYSAWYAVYPHEMGIEVHRGKNIRWTRKFSGAKFFQSALERVQPFAPKILYKEMNLMGKRKPRRKL